MKKPLLSILSFFLLSATFASTNYQNQAEILYKQMTLDEKIGQLLLPTYRLLATSVDVSSKNPGSLCKTALQGNDKNKIIKNCGLEQIKKYHIGAVLQDGGPNFNEPSYENWRSFNSLAKEVHNQVQHDPLLLIGNDAIHGNSHVAGAVIFPHNINLGVTHDPELVQMIGELTADDSLATGFNWAYMPTVAIAEDFRWGRTYESFGQNPALVKSLAKAYILGFQQPKSDKITGVLATAKHFIGDGATQYGLDEGDAIFSGSQQQFWNQYGAGYEGALEAGMQNIMVSYSAINHQRMHFGGEWDILNSYKNNGLFTGFAVSDYNGPTRAAYFYKLQHPNELNTLPQIFAKSINAGVDMIMLGNGDTQNPFDPNSPFNYATVGEAFSAVKSAYVDGLISEARLKDAVTRILATKLAMASQIKNAEYTDLQAKQREVALKAAQESMVLLKNEGQTLPLKQEQIQHVIFIGDTNDVGIQNGGWTINWQGQKGNRYFEGKNRISSGATTIEETLTKKMRNVAIHHVQDVDSQLDHWTANNTVAIVVVAEPPYAEYMGDIGNPYEADQLYEKGVKSGENAYMPKKQSQQLQLQWNTKTANAVKSLRNKGIRVITIVFSGRPIVLSEGGLKAPLPNSDVVIAAFLPGTLGGQALATAILGEYHVGQNGVSNQLSFPWPRDMKDIENHFVHGMLYPVGYGLRS